MSIHDRLDLLYGVGGGPGANRPAYSPAEDEAHDVVAGWMREAGLDVTRDAAGNLFGRRLGALPELPEVWTGSHLDSVPHGGRLDGPLGVLAGLEAVERIGATTRTLVLVAFRDEEGWRFGRGCFGSRALCGRLEPGELETRDSAGVLLGDLVGQLPAAGWLETLPGAYLEAHIEQGPVLDGLDAPLGIVTSIVGLARLAVSFRGAAGHAGTTPMAARDDALCKAAAFILAVRDIAEDLCREGSRGERGPVATVGTLTVEPGAANVIPDRVDLVVDARAADEETLQELLRRIEAAGVEGRAELRRRTSPVPMAATVAAVLRNNVPDAAPELASGAGHDAGVLGAAGVPAGMLFVRSRNGGVSHSPDEDSDPEDIERCVDVLTGALRELASVSAELR